MNEATSSLTRAGLQANVADFLERFLGLAPRRQHYLRLTRDVVALEHALFAFKPKFRPAT